MPTATSPHIDALLRRMQAFLEEPEHEIVRVYSDDLQREPLYCGLALSWEEERDVLLAEVKRLLAQEGKP